jgi:methionyl-tRNA formyltransferase
MLGADAMLEAAKALESGAVHYSEQLDSQASKAPKLKKEEAQIDWGESAVQIFNRIRAFKPFPSTHTMLKQRRLGIEWAEPLGRDSGYSPSEICAVEKEWFDVQCGKGVLRVLDVKPEGGKKMKCADFLRGTKISAGMVLK